MPCVITALHSNFSLSTVSSFTSFVHDHFTAPYYVVHEIISAVLRSCDQLDYQLSCSLDPIWHISTNAEGIHSHFMAILRLRHNLIQSNRSGNIVETTFHAQFHYPDHDNVNICDVFIFPPGVICTKTPLLEIVHKLDCITDNRTFAYLERHFLLPPNSFSKKSLAEVKFEEVDCLVGWVVPIGHWKLTPYPEFGFQKRYKSMWPKIRAVIGAVHSPFAVIHWRRGEQLSYKCHGRGGGWDRSINCANSTDEFVQLARESVGKTCPNVSAVYVATNERSPVQLGKLASAGYALYSNISRALESFHVDSLDNFVIELMLMCESDCFFAWGSSHVHDLIRVFFQKGVRFGLPVMLGSGCVGQIGGQISSWLQRAGYMLGLGQVRNISIGYG
jgi:hypothetical protein